MTDREIAEKYAEESISLAISMYNPRAESIAKFACLYGLRFKNEQIAELEAQIEKMKCCYNCKHSRTEYEHCRTDKHEKWEIKENDRK